MNVLARSLAIALLSLAVLPGRVLAQNHPENDPENCSDIWKEVGLPKTPGEDITTVCHLGYITGNNNSRKAPSWVIEKLTPALVKGKATRENQSFSEDDKVPAKGRATTADYDGNGLGFDQGHNAAAADFSGKQEFLDDTFFLSNSVPQVGVGFNRSIWRTLETRLRGLVGDNRSEIYVITGSIFQDGKPIKIRNDICRSELEIPVVKPASICPENHGKKNAQCESGVAVPAAMFKVVYNPKTKSAFSVLLQNESHTGNYKNGVEYIRAHKVGLATIEDLSGLKFFPDFPLRKQRVMRSACVEVLSH